MKNLFFLLFLFCTGSSYGKSIEDIFIGTWDGFQYVEDEKNSIREGQVNRLIIERLTGSRDSLRCIIIGMPGNSLEYLSPQVDSYIFNAHITDGMLVRKYVSLVTARITETSIVPVKDGNNIKLRIRNRVM